MDIEKISETAKDIFSLYMEAELDDAEVVASTTQALIMRIAFSCHDIEELEEKLEKLPGIFLSYARANLSAAQSAILQKQQEIQKGMH